MNQIIVFNDLEFEGPIKLLGGVFAFVGRCLIWFFGMYSIILVHRYGMAVVIYSRILHHLGRVGMLRLEIGCQVGVFYLISAILGEIVVQLIVLGFDDCISADSVGLSLGLCKILFLRFKVIPLLLILIGSIRLEIQLTVRLAVFKLRIHLYKSTSNYYFYIGIIYASIKILWSV